MTPDIDELERLTAKLDTLGKDTPSGLPGFPLCAEAAQAILSLIKQLREANRERDDLVKALKLARDYLNVSLGSPTWTGENPYPVIEAALERARKQ